MEKPTEQRADERGADSLHPDCSAALDKLLEHYGWIKAWCKEPLTIALQKPENKGALSGIIILLNKVQAEREKQQNNELSEVADSAAETAQQPRNNHE